VFVGRGPLTIGAGRANQPLDTCRTTWYNPCVEAKTFRPHVIRVRVSDQERELAEDAAAREDRSVSEVIRRALREYHQRRLSSTHD